MPLFTLNISDEMLNRILDWSKKSHKNPEYLPLELLDEYFDDCDDADKLEALIRSGNMETYPANLVHKEFHNLAAMEC